MVNSVLAGYNGTIMAYGQTGSGKTHTLIVSCPCGHAPHQHIKCTRAYAAVILHRMHLFGSHVARHIAHNSSPRCVCFRRVMCPSRICGALSPVL